MDFEIKRPMCPRCGGVSPWYLHVLNGAPAMNATVFMSTVEEPDHCCPNCKKNQTAHEGFDNEAKRRGWDK